MKVTNKRYRLIDGVWVVYVQSKSEECRVADQRDRAERRRKRRACMAEVRRFTDVKLRNTGAVRRYIVASTALRADDAANAKLTSKARAVKAAANKPSEEYDLEAIFAEARALGWEPWLKRASGIWCIGAGAALEWASCNMPKNKYVIYVERPDEAL